MTVCSCNCESHAVGWLHAQALYGIDGAGVPSVPELRGHFRLLHCLRCVGMFGILAGRQSNVSWEAQVLLSLLSIACDASHVF